MKRVERLFFLLLREEGKTQRTKYQRRCKNAILLREEGKTQGGQDVEVSDSVFRR